jgi:AGZA family xanthine/uracil permease-like MFS transporter
MINAIARFFKFDENHTNFQAQVIAGCTTFLTMAYIIIVCPALLKNTGMNPQAVFTATCCAAAIGSMLMGLWANYPIALAPSMSLFPYSTYSRIFFFAAKFITRCGCFAYRRSFAA